MGGNSDLNTKIWCLVERIGGLFFEEIYKISLSKTEGKYARKAVINEFSHTYSQINAADV